MVDTVGISSTSFCRVCIIDDLYHACVGCSNKIPGRKFTRSVVVVADGCENVPQGRQRQFLHEKGIVVSFIDLWTNWSEKEVCESIESSLNSVTDVTKPYPRYYFRHIILHNS